MGKKYMDTKKGSLEQSILGVWDEAAKMHDEGFDGRTKEYREHRKKLESARVRREEKKSKPKMEQPQTEHGSGEHAFELGTKRFDEYTKEITPGQIEEEIEEIENEIEEVFKEFGIEYLPEGYVEEADAPAAPKKKGGLLGKIGKGALNVGKAVAKTAGRAAKDAVKGAAGKVYKASGAKGAVDAVKKKVGAAKDKVVGIAKKAKKAAATGTAYQDNSYHPDFAPMIERLEDLENELNTWIGQLDEQVALEEEANMSKDGRVQLKSLRETVVDMWKEAADTHVNPKDREELDKAPEKTAKKMKRADEPAPNVTEEVEELDEKLTAKQKKIDVDGEGEIEGSDLAKLRKKAKKEGKTELEVAKEFKVNSMKEALAKVWGFEKEGYNPYDKSKKGKKESVKKAGDKTDTGEDIAAIELDPKIKDKK